MHRLREPTLDEEAPACSAMGDKNVETFSGVIAAKAGGRFQTDTTSPPVGKLDERTNPGISEWGLLVRFVCEPTGDECDASGLR